MERIALHKIDETLTELRICAEQIETLTSKGIDVWAEHGARRVTKFELLEEWRARENWARVRLGWWLNDLRQSRAEAVH